MNGLSHWVHWVATALRDSGWSPPWRRPSDPPGEMQVLAFGKLPALASGRIKPLDTVAPRT